MSLNIFYNPNQTVENNNSYSPSAGKPKMIAELFSKVENVKLVSDFRPLTRDEIKLAHNSDFVDGVLDCKLKNGFGNTLKSIADSLPWTNGSFYAAAEYALKNKTVAMSPTSGFHHAEYDKAEGFCTFNGLMITALLLKQNYDVKNLTILDFDAHFGNGAEQIIDFLKINWINNCTFGAFADDIKKNEGSKGFDNWLDFLENDHDFIEEIIKESDIILYQAGADPHVDDPQGGYLTTEQMRKRDEIVFKTTSAANIPIVWNLAGGYQTPIQKVLDLHLMTLNECRKAYGF